MVKKLKVRKSGDLWISGVASSTSPWSRSLIVAERQSALVLDCTVGPGPTSATLAIERDAASIALDVHLEDC
jgi:hypothetical protein